MARPETPDILAGLGQGDDDAMVAAMGPRVMALNISAVRLDGGTQPRAGIDQAVVADYATDMEANGAEFPPVQVVYDGTEYWLWDGFHRLHARKRNGLYTVPAIVRQGTRRDAVLLSVGANATHGFRRTNEDKRRAVMALLHDEEWGQWSDSEIARRCAVSHPFVGKLRAELSCNGYRMETRRVERNGVEYDMKLPERSAAPAVASQGGEFATAVELAAAVRSWLVAYDTAEEREAALAEVCELGEGSVTFDDLAEWIDVKPRRAEDLIQAAKAVLTEVRWEMAAEEPERARPFVPVDIAEQVEVEPPERARSETGPSGGAVGLTREERMAAALEYDRERKYMARAAADTFVVYAEDHEYTGILRWIAYRINQTAQWSDVRQATRRELWRMIGSTLVDEVLARQDRNTSLERLRAVIDERFQDAGLNGVPWPDEEVRG